MLKFEKSSRGCGVSLFSAVYALANAFFIVMSGIALPAQAQTIAGISPEAPQQFSMRDLGVNLSTTDIQFQHVDISVGSGEFPARLDLVRTYNMIGQPGLNLPKQNLTTQYHGFGHGSQHNFLIYFTCQTCNNGIASARIINMTVVALGKSYHFSGTGPTGSNPVLAQDDDDGATMRVIDPTQAVWTYQLTTKDGTTIIFSDGSGYQYDPFGGRFAKYVEFPNGEFLTYQYTASPFASGVVRLTSVTNSRGYGLVFSYGSAASALVRQGATSDPSLVSSISSTKTTIGSGQSILATVSYAYDSSGDLTSVTDPAGNVTRYQYDSLLRLTNVFNPGNTTTIPSLSISYLNGFSQVTGPILTFYSGGAGLAVPPLGDNNHDVQWSTPASVTDALGNTTSFAFSDPTAPDPISVTVTNPDGGTRGYSTIFCSTSPACSIDPYFMKSPTTAVSELGTITRYAYDNHGRILSRTLPEGGSDSLARDANGNVTQLTRHAKSGSGLSDVSSYAGYPLCNGSNMKICNKPAYTIDARGNRWDFQYDPISGQLAVSLAPADANNMRAVTRYSYSAFSPGPVSPPSGIATPTTYLLTAKDECLTSTVLGASTDFSYVCAAGSRRRTLFNFIPSTPASPSSAELANVIDDSDAVAATTQYAYDSVGNVTSAAAPNGNSSFTTYDALRRKVFEIGADPDGAGPLPRPVVHHVYDADGNETRTESGTGFLTNGTDFTTVRFKRMTYDLNDRLVKIEEVTP